MALNRLPVLDLIDYYNKSDNTYIKYIKKTTYLLLSYQIFATPLFAINEDIYNSQGMKDVK